MHEKLGKIVFEAISKATFGSMYEKSKQIFDELCGIIDLGPFKAYRLLTQDNYL